MASLPGSQTAPPVHHHQRPPIYSACTRRVAQTDRPSTLSLIPVTPLIAPTVAARSNVSFRGVEGVDEMKGSVGRLMVEVMKGRSIPRAGGAEAGSGISEGVCSTTAGASATPSINHRSQTHPSPRSPGQKLAARQLFCMRPHLLRFIRLARIGTADAKEDFKRIV